MENFVSVGRDRTPIYVYHAMLRILRAVRIRACRGERTFDKNRWRNRFFPSEILASFTLENAFASNLADWTYPLGGRELRTALFPRLSLSLSLSFSPFSLQHRRFDQSVVRLDSRGRLRRTFASARGRLRAFSATRKGCDSARTGMR